MRWEEITCVINYRSHNLKKFPQTYAVFMGVSCSHSEDIMHSFQKFIVVSLPTTLATLTVLYHQFGIPNFNKFLSLNISEQRCPGEARTWRMTK